MTRGGGGASWRRRGDEAVVLDARLALPGGTSRHLTLAPGDAVLLGDDDGPSVVAALLEGPGSLRRRLRPRHRIVVNGRRLHRLGAARRVRRGLAAVHGAPVAADVSVLDHLAAVAGRRDAARLLADAPLLAGRGSDPAGLLSGGERLVLAWLTCQAVHPQVVVLDRAGVGLHADTLRWADGVVARWRAAGTAVVVRAGRTEERAWAAPTP